MIRKQQQLGFKIVIRALLLLLVLTYLSLGCSHNAPPSDLVIAIESYPTNLDPRYIPDAYSTKLHQLLFNGLLKFDEQLRLVPDLAERYEYLSETRIRFYLRRDVRFHNG